MHHLREQFRRVIHAEIVAIESGQADPKNNPLKNAPHTADVVSGDKWDRPYSREQAAYPMPGLRDFKFWPAVARVAAVRMACVDS